MCVSRLILLAGTAFQATPALAADALKFGPTPAWVVPQAMPAAPTSGQDRPVAILLHDQQTVLKPGIISNYSELAYKIQTPEGLAAGNVALSWDPATDTITVNKVEIHRGSQVIDVLAGGQKFTTVRREPNLEAATLDGVLTATMQPEGLQQGDTVVIATTTEHSDPVMKGHVEAAFAPWSTAQIGLAHARLQWPSGLGVKVQAKGDLPLPRQGARDGQTSYEITKTGIEPVIAPKDAPIRFSVGRLGEASDFRSWADAARLMMPLYSAAAVVPATGPLRDELEKIRKASTDPRRRAETALSLVEDRVRYVALLMGEGGFVPAAASETWERRFGDCKAKTALLLALLHELGITAEPVLANPTLGDAIADRLPMIGVFNHVFVRARIGGSDYWLDGTRTGDTSLDSIEVPNYGWGLPLVEGAQLVHLTPAPLKAPSQERRVAVDAMGGVFAPAAITITETYRGDNAVEFNNTYAALTGAQKDEVFRREANDFFDGFAVTSSSLAFDQAKREFTVSIKGTAKLSWNNGWLYVPTSSIAFTPDFARPAGPLHDAPIAINHPRFALDIATFKLPAGFAARQKIDPPVHETLAGVEYDRSEVVNGDTLTVTSSERSLVPEVAYRDALAAAARLKALDKDDVYLSGNVPYSPTQKDLAALPQQTPTSVNDYLDRGNLFLDGAKYDEAIADFTKAIEVDPKNVFALADRALGYIYKNRLEAADKDLIAAAEIQPNNAVVLRARGLFFERKGEWKAAISSYEGSLQAEPRNIWAVKHKVSAEVGAGLYDQARADLDRALDSDPNSIELRGARATIFTMQHKTDEALHEIQLIEKMKPADDTTLTMLGSLYQALGMTDRAKQVFGQAMTLSSTDDPRSLGRKAMLENQTGKTADALADSAKALTLDPHLQDLRVLRANILYIRGDRAAVAAEAVALTKDNPDSDYAFVGAGKIYARIGMNDEAFKAFDQAIAINPKAYIYINRSQIRPKTDFKARLADLDLALKVEPNSFDALYAKSEVLRDSGDYAGALAALDAVGAVMQPQLRTQRAFLLYKSGHTDEAVKQFEAIRASTTDPTELNNLCYDKATAGIMLESALQDCTEALKLSPGNPSFEDSMGLVLLKVGKLDEAIATYTKVLAQVPIPASYLGRAFAYLRKGNAAAAQKDRAEANSRMPGIETEFAGYGLKFDTPPPAVKPAPSSKPKIVSVRPL